MSEIGKQLVALFDQSPTVKPESDWRTGFLQSCNEAKNYFNGDLGSMLQFDFLCLAVGLYGDNTARGILTPDEWNTANTLGAKIREGLQRKARQRARTLPLARVAYSLKQRGLM